MKKRLLRLACGTCSALLIAAATGCTATFAQDSVPADKRAETSPLARLESVLRKNAKMRLNLLFGDFVELYVHPLPLDEALAKSRELPLSAQQAREKLVAWLRSHPESDDESRRVHRRSYPTLERMDNILCYIVGDYYYFPGPRIHKLRSPLVGFFVDSQSGEVIAYPPRSYSGDSPYEFAGGYGEDAGRLFFDPNDAEGLFALGCCHEKGQGATPSAQKAAECWRRAAEQGDERARLRLAECYEQGKGVPQSYDDALRLYLELADKHDNADAQYRIGRLYAEGRGVPASPEQAVIWYRRAADCKLPHREACLALGECYEKGIGVTASREEAIAWYRIAARRSYSSRERRDVRRALRRLGVEK